MRAGRFVRVVLGAAALLVPQASIAAITAYTSQAAFLAAISAPGVDTFDDLQITYMNSPLARTAGSWSYTAGTVGGFFPAGTGADVWLATNTADMAITIDIAGGGVFALGGLFFVSDIKGVYQPGDMSIAVQSTTGTLSQTITAATTGSFLGFVSDSPLSGATIAAVQPVPDFAWATVNNLTLGAPAVSAVPEPASWALMILGLGVVGAGLRRTARPFRARPALSV